MRIWFARLLTGLLCLCLVFGEGVALSQSATPAPQDGTPLQAAEAGGVLEDPAALTGTAEPTATPDETTVQYVASATLPLKVRRSPDKEAYGNGSIEQGGLVYILELGNEWCKVDTGRNIGYVQTKYLTDVRPFVQGTDATAAQDVTALTPTATPDTTADSPQTFVENFKASTIKAVTMRASMDERSAAAGTLKKYEEVIVSANRGDWSYIRANNRYGYVRTDALFKWDRIDPFAGAIPGLTVHAGLAFVNRTVDLYNYPDRGNEKLKTVNPGAALAVDTKDAMGRYPLPYWRTTAYVDEADVGYFMPVVPWEDAQSGDLISCMSTYYELGIYSINYRGRNYNIYLGTSFISGLVVHPGESINIYDVMGPYRSSTGYHRAPIMSANALWGYGGGVCQVNTTLYNALIQVPIFINWRKVHADVGIYYCPVGFDSAVGGGDITMIFTNTLPYTFRVNFFMSDGCLTVGIFRV